MTNLDSLLVAYFTFWSPYVVVVLIESFFSWFRPASGIEFAVMWLANSNSAVNVFIYSSTNTPRVRVVVTARLVVVRILVVAVAWIYSSTNTQFRRHCVLLASKLVCCSRLSCVWFKLLQTHSCLPFSLPYYVIPFLQTGTAFYLLLQISCHLLLHYKLAYIC